MYLFKKASVDRILLFYSRDIQAQEALQNGQLGSGEGIPDLQPGVLASQAMIEKTLTEDPRWQGEQPLHPVICQTDIRCRVSKNVCFFPFQIQILF